VSTNLPTTGPSTPESFDLTISDPLLLLNSIAKRYESPVRILMEFVDNPLDDAEEMYLRNCSSYPYEIRIGINIDTRRAQVTITDNCRGMTRAVLQRIVRNVGQSMKRGRTWVNGEFGFGVHAFRAAAERIGFRTKNADDALIELSFTREQRTGIRPPAEVPGTFPTTTGTTVIISGFDPDSLRELTADAVRREIQLHFERLLARPNLVIEVSQDGGTPIRCQPFDYDAHPGTPFRRNLVVNHNGVNYPVEVNLKVCTTPVPDLVPRFFRRGRRINEARYIRSFMTKSRSKSGVWGHDHLVGYIEVGEAVAPVITRDDFERTQLRGKLYDVLLPLEAELRAALEAINRQQQDRRLTRLEDVLRNVLSSLAKQDALQFRTEVAGAGNEVPTLPGGATADPGKGAPTGENNGGGEGGGGGGEGGGNGTTGNGKGKLPGDGEDGVCRDPDPEPNTPNASTRRKSGFDIKFQSLPPDIHGKVCRSRFLDGTIFINVAHEDFDKRVGYSRQGGLRLTERLVNYLAGVVSIHYKDVYYDKYKNQPDRRDQLFDEQVDFICRLEAALVPQIGALQCQLNEDLGQEGGRER
jgi:hypothetical protein